MIKLPTRRVVAVEIASGDGAVISGSFPPHAPHDLAEQRIGGIVPASGRAQLPNLSGFRSW